jgi:hypothetical protein
MVALIFSDQKSTWEFPISTESQTGSNNAQGSNKLLSFYQKNPLDDVMWFLSPKWGGELDSYHIAAADATFISCLSATSQPWKQHEQRHHCISCIDTSTDLVLPLFLCLLYQKHLLSKLLWPRFFMWHKIYPQLCHIKKINLGNAFMQVLCSRINADKYMYAHLYVFRQAPIGLTYARPIFFIQVYVVHKPV